jgi:hypothetical protein
MEARNDKSWTTDADAFVVGVDVGFDEDMDGNFGGGANGVARRRRGATVGRGASKTHDSWGSRWHRGAAASVA